MGKLRASGPLSRTAAIMLWNADVRIYLGFLLRSNFPFVLLPRTSSKSALAVKEEEPNEGDDAKNFLMTTARKSLTKALEGPLLLMLLQTCPHCGRHLEYA